MKTATLSDLQVRNRLEAMRRKPSTWRAISGLLGMGPGYLFLVASGKRPPSPKLVRALLKHQPKTFEERCAAWDRFSAEIQPEVEGIINALPQEAR